MKVLFLYKYGILGGVCTQLHHRLLGLVDKEIEVHCGFMTNHGAEELLGNLCTLHFSLAPERIVELIEEVGFELVVIIDTEEYIHKIVDIKTPTKIVIEVHTSIERNLEYLSRLPSDLQLTFITVSDYMRHEVSKRIGVERNKITVIANILDKSSFDFVRVEPSKQDHPPPLIWVGKIDDHKNWELALEISSSLIKSGFNHELWIIGGHTASQATAEYFFSEIDQIGMIPHVKWFDKIEHDSMADFIRTGIQRGGVGLVTSKAESFGMSILESLVLGMPVVSSDTGAIPELCRNRDFLRLYSLNDPGAAIQHITDLAGKWIHDDHLVDKFANEALSLSASFSSKLAGTVYWQALLDINANK
jgi:glycosyltransferase involved in cell wall biosynthesis